MAGGRRATDTLLADFQPFIHQKNLPVPVIIALIDGLLQDQRPVRIADERALRRYAYRVAGTVGLLMCHVLDCDDDAARAHAIDLGIAMQLTNIARDVLEDAEMGRRYLPASWAGDVKPAHITAASNMHQMAKLQGPLVTAVGQLCYWPMTIIKVGPLVCHIYHCAPILRLRSQRGFIVRSGFRLRRPDIVGIRAGK